MSVESVQSLKATLRIAQLDSNDDTNPTWDDFECALATVACIECMFAWLLYGDGAICLLHRERVFLRGSSTKEAK
jgi:hypothetical protein